MTVVNGNQGESLIIRYPACLQSLALIAFVCFFFYFLLFVSLFSFIISQGVPFYLLGIFVVYVLVNIVFEYGQEIISESFVGREEAPVFSVQTFDRGRFFRQLLMTAFFGGLIFGLIQYGLIYAAIGMSVFVAFALPASLSVNAIFEDLGEVINPRTLIGYIAVTKWSYLSSLMGLFVLALLFYFSLQLGLGVLSIALPFWLYLSLIYFRHLGLVAQAHRHILLPEKDFAADKKAIEQHYSDNAAIHAALEKAYWGLKENRIEEAIKIVNPIIRMGDWARFDFVFDFISAWPDKVPALHFVQSYLPTLKTRAESIRALQLCEWCLKQEQEFLVEDTDVIDYLNDQAVALEQFVVMVKLMENFVAENPEHPKSIAYLTRAADICQDKLHHAEKFEELQAKLKVIEDS